jgi:hypothetical protein
MAIVQYGTRYVPSAVRKGNGPAVAGLVAGVVALPLAFAAQWRTPALLLAALSVGVSGVALAGAIAGRRTGRHIAGAGAAAGLLASLILIVAANQGAGLPPASAPDPIVSAVAPSLSDMSVKVGSYGKVGVPVVVTNSSLKQRSVDLTVEAVTKRGKRIATDTVSASRVEPGTTSTVTAFVGETGALGKQLKSAKFRLIETTSFSR